MNRARDNSWRAVGRGGFTLMETLLAASLGGLVVMASLGIMAAIDRMDKATEARFQDADAMARLHLVMERTFSNLVMADASVGAAQQPQTQGGGSRAERVARDGIVQGEKESQPRPRFLVEADRSPSLEGMVSKAQRQGLIGGGGATVQRLEVVLSRAPVPPGFGRSTTQEVLAAVDSVSEESVAVRGVFELRPDAATPPGAVTGLSRPADGEGWTLWWRPLPPNADGANEQVYLGDPTQDAAAVVIATGLVECQWISFKLGERTPELSALQFQDLPAYMEMKVRTARGMAANWMFEVGWSNGPETRTELEEAEEAEAAAQENGGQGGFGGPGGGPGGGRGGRGGQQGDVRQFGPGGPADGMGGRGGSRGGGRSGQGGGQFGTPRGGQGGQGGQRGGAGQSGGQGVRR